MTKRLDVVTIGRCSVDLYAQQIGTRLEDAASFAKSVGGCPANIAIGTARLGLRSALITRVGAEQMGDFVREQMVREGVETAGIAVDPTRLTALVLLAVENADSSPMIFYRDNCADMALEEADVDPDLVASARAVLVTGTHFSRPAAAAAQRKAMRIARESGGKIVFDIDYRPNLWGLGGHEAGFSRYVKSDTVSRIMREILPEADLIVGTEEEIRIAAGEEDVLAALRTIRAWTTAPLVLKRGARGCVIFAGAIGSLDDGIQGAGFPVEVLNVLGAGDAFMSGLLSGWIRGEPLTTCATLANACGAFAVARLLCSPEYPTQPELAAFLAETPLRRRPRTDPVLNHLHWVTTRRAQPESLMAFAIDHRSQLEAVADALGVSRGRLSDFKALAVAATARVARGRPGFGMLLDSTYGQKAFPLAARHGFWIGRPVEKPGSRPLDFDQLPDLGSHLQAWPVHHTIKCLCFWHPDDPAELKRQQERELLRVYDAARTLGRELLVEIIAGKHGTLDEETVASIVEHIYGLGIKPDWWKLEPQHDPAAWHRIAAIIERDDPFCRGIVLLGLDAPEDVLVAAFRAAAGCSRVKGFAVGRTLFAEPARRWLAGEIDDEAAISEMARRFDGLVAAWEGALQLRAA
ncbi:bifunctional 5-dehydro-2-deoxygluconokinase/5-dehydro-2-deoxyphosphogluconate aldolase [Methylobacterium soli]|uniref:5-dehydro-2-deoxygluconokinase n=1 Tax=Methylobacterium soli TaxID=553447 RepID=A0A6L3SUR9_9HYPH|nr:5-dehydro-2-deoxygluconokinase [Methylobacterium soli]KAB1077403.1 5-dehydro-2-deoxygluconokinase [Methylobacterium soli]GJE44426.1 5-dehydro-2-deoxygluconokinase [Methylobacterium soli]